VREDTLGRAALDESCSMNRNGSPVAGSVKLVRASAASKISRMTAGVIALSSEPLRRCTQQSQLSDQPTESSAS